MDRVGPNSLIEGVQSLRHKLDRMQGASDDELVDMVETGSDQRKGTAKSWNGKSASRAAEGETAKQAQRQISLRKRILGLSIKADSKECTLQKRIVTLVPTGELITKGILNEVTDALEQSEGYRRELGSAIAKGFTSELKVLRSGSGRVPFESRMRNALVKQFRHQPPEIMKEALPEALRKICEQHKRTPGVQDACDLIGKAYGVEFIPSAPALEKKDFLQPDVNSMSAAIRASLQDTRRELRRPRGILKKPPEPVKPPQPISVSTSAVPVAAVVAPAVTAPTAAPEPVRSAKDLKEEQIEYLKAHIPENKLGTAASDYYATRIVDLGLVDDFDAFKAMSERGKIEKALGWVEEVMFRDVVEQAAAVPAESRPSEPAPRAAPDADTMPSLLFTPGDDNPQFSSLNSSLGSGAFSQRSIVPDYVDADHRTVFLKFRELVSADELSDADLADALVNKRLEGEVYEQADFSAMTPQDKALWKETLNLPEITRQAAQRRQSKLNKIHRQDVEKAEQPVNSSDYLNRQSRELEALRTRVCRLDTMDKVSLNLLEDKGFIDYGELQRRAVSDVAFNEYIEDRKKAYRGDYGNLPVDNAKPWQGIEEQFMSHCDGLQRGGLNYENLNLAISLYCQLCCFDTISAATLEQAWQHLQQNVLSLMPPALRSERIITEILNQNLERFRNFLPVDKATQLQEAMQREIVKPKQRPVAPPRTKHSPERQLQEVNRELSFRLQDSELAAIRASGINPGAAGFVDQMHAWLILQNHDEGFRFPMPFETYLKLIEEGRMLNQVTQEICSAYLAYYGNPDINSKRRIKEAGALVMKAFFKAHTALVNATEEELNHFTTMNCWQAGICDRVNDVYSLYLLHSAMRGENQALTTDDVAYALSENLVNAKEGTNAVLYSKQEMEDRRRQAANSRGVQIIAAELGDNPEMPSFRTYKVCHDMIAMASDRNPEHYYRRDLKGKSAGKEMDACLIRMGLASLGGELQHNANNPGYLQGLIAETLSDEQWGLKLSPSELEQDTRMLLALLNMANRVNGQDMSCFKDVKSKRYQNYLELVLRRMGRNRVHGLAGDLKNHLELLQASNTVATFEDRLRSTRTFQASYKRPEMNQMLVTQLDCRLGQKAPPDGSCGFHSVSSLTGDTSAEVRYKASVVARDIGRLIENPRAVLSSDDPRYGRNVKHAVADWNEKKAAFGLDDNAMKKRHTYIAHNVEEEGVPKGSQPGEFWLQERDAQFVAIAYKRPVILLDRFANTRTDTKYPGAHFYYDADGVMKDIDQSINQGADQIRDLMINDDAICLVKMGGLHWEHWEPVEVLPVEHRALTAPRAEDIQPMTDGDIYHYSSDEESDQQRESLRARAQYFSDEQPMSLKTIETVADRRTGR